MRQTRRVVMLAAFLVWNAAGEEGKKAEAARAAVQAQFRQVFQEAEAKPEFRQQREMFERLVAEMESRKSERAIEEAVRAAALDAELQRQKAEMERAVRLAEADRPKDKDDGAQPAREQR